MYSTIYDGVTMHALKLYNKIVFLWIILIMLPFNGFAYSKFTVKDLHLMSQYKYFQPVQNTVVTLRVGNSTKTCSGVALNPSTIITAANCFYRSPFEKYHVNTQLIQPLSLVLWYIDNPLSMNIKRVQYSELEIKVILPQAADNMMLNFPQNMNSDIAIIKLKPQNLNNLIPATSTLEGNGIEIENKDVFTNHKDYQSHLILLALGANFVNMSGANVSGNSIGDCEEEWLRGELNSLNWARYRFFGITDYNVFDRSLSNMSHWCPDPQDPAKKVFLANPQDDGGPLFIWSQKTDKMKLIGIQSYVNVDDISNTTMFTSLIENSIWTTVRNKAGL